ncbi:hypothetical protein EA462_11005 [Natrarchaeobius halalkaliphilus]|uniref:ZIP family metal transporter n=1 Tax=Natrarchaeobius halalkaliphilus TaxID=1679091 RepID=A0A3N6P1G2_9EURY|nr:hypothetical protein [Natrarchaeobius halalkaliphilus]RQG88915.1 hypothetical protein EA462_11005 [Natrarchaeobius halalkaliphilus]
MSLAFAASIDGETVLVAVLVALVTVAHLLPDELSVSVGLSRHDLLSLTGGVSIVYAFLHLLPELDERQEALEGVPVLVWSLASHHVYAVAFVGLALFYGLERLARMSRSYGVERELGSVGEEPVFWIHVGGFAVYNAFIGYALVQGETGTDNVALFGVAMALHLFGNDEAMQHHHRELYSRFGKWILAGAVVLGAAVGVGYTIDDVTVTTLLGLLTGGILFNSIKDELPRTRESRFWPFALGSGTYAVVLLLL